MEINRNLLSGLGLSQYIYDNCNIDIMLIIHVEYGVNNHVILSILFLWFPLSELKLFLLYSYAYTLSLLILRVIYLLK